MIVKFRQGTEERTMSLQVVQEVPRVGEFVVASDKVRGTVVKVIWDYRDYVNGFVQEPGAIVRLR